MSSMGKWVSSFYLLLNPTFGAGIAMTPAAGGAGVEGAAGVNSEGEQGELHTRGIQLLDLNR